MGWGGLFASEALELESFFRKMYWDLDPTAAKTSLQPYLTQSIFEVVLQKSIPTRTRQLILYISNSEG